MRYWHDAKGRALFVVTPRRHVRSLVELGPDEVYQLWRGAIQVGACAHTCVSTLRLSLSIACEGEGHRGLHVFPSFVVGRWGPNLTGTGFYVKNNPLFCTKNKKKPTDPAGHGLRRGAGRPAGHDPQRR